MSNTTSNEDTVRELMPDEAFVHILPSELEQMERREMSTEVASVAFTNVDSHERSVPLYTEAQVQAAIRTALAPQAVEPVAHQWLCDGQWINLGCEKNLEGMRNAGYEVRPLYAGTPPAPALTEAQELTDDDIYSVMGQTGILLVDNPSKERLARFARAVLARAAIIAKEPEQAADRARMEAMKGAV